MPTTVVRTPFQFFTDANGDPLEAGYIYIGTINLNPETNPISVFWDQALTIPAAQPIRTLSGYPVRNGSVATIYTNSEYSIEVKDKNQVLVFSELNSSSSRPLSILVDGSTDPIANLPMAGFKHTGVGAAANLTDYARTDQVQNSAFSVLGTVAGTVNEITALASPTPSAYLAGQRFSFVAAGANTGPVTINISNLGVKSITKNGPAALVTGDIVPGAVISIEYDGNRFQLLGHAATAVTAQPRKNAIINSGCQVKQRYAVTVTNIPQFVVDRIETYAGGTVTAGTIDQAETTLLGSSGYASAVTGYTNLSSPSLVQLYWRYRIESKDVQRFIDKAAIFSAIVYHDVGSAFDYHITISKADAKDNFSTITTIQSSGAISVGTNIASKISIAVPDMASCGNGVEILILANIVNNVTTEDFYITEFQFELGSIATDFEQRLIAEELALCQRYFQRIVIDVNARILVGHATSTTAVNAVVTYTQKRINPTSVTIGTPASLKPMTAVGGIPAGTISWVPSFLGLERARLAATSTNADYVAGNAAIILSDSVSNNIDINAEL